MENLKCYNKKCINRRHKLSAGCSSHWSDNVMDCKLFVSYLNRKSINKPNQLNGKILYDFETKGLRKYSKSHTFDGLENIYSLEGWRLPNLNKKQDNSYNFRGEINIPHLINDCIKDGKHCFLAISKQDGIIGISKQLGIANKCKITNQFKDSWDDDLEQSFYIVYINKSDIPLAVKELTRVSKLIKNRIRNIGKKLHKNKKAGKFSNKPETKVMTF